MYKAQKNRYLKRGRLSDVIGLISFLSFAPGEGFVTEQSARDSLRSEPRSAPSWFAIAEQHYELFRFNGARDHIALTLRSYQPVADNARAPLKITETQEIIDVAIALHDKELSRKQRYVFVVPIIVAIIASVVSIYTAVLISNRPDTEKAAIEAIQNSLNRMENKLYESQQNNVPSKSVPLKIIQK